jgi:hypothetical protein
MAVNAKFVADFTSFNAAVDKAELQLKSFQTSSAGVERQLTRVTNAFSGQRIIQEAQLTVAAIDRLGGTSRLTGSELERAGNLARDAADKMRALGIDVPPKIEALATAAKKPTSAFDSMTNSVKGFGAALVASFSVGAIANAIQSTGEWAGHVDDLSKKMGISREAVQRLDFAARQNGQTIDGVSTAVAQLSKHLVSGDQGAVDAMQRLGLSFAQIKGLSPDQAFAQIAQAIDTLPNQFDKSATAMQLLGRSGADLIPMFGSLTQDMRNAAVASDDTIKAGDQLGDAWDKLKGAGAVLVANVLTPMAPALQRIADAAGDAAKKINDFERARKSLAESDTHGVTSGAAMGLATPTGLTTGLTNAVRLANELRNSISDTADLVKAPGIFPEQFSKGAIPVEDAERMMKAFKETKPDAEKLLTTAEKMRDHTFTIAKYLESWAPAIQSAGESMKPLQNFATNISGLMRAIPDALDQGISGTVTKTTGLLGSLKGGLSDLLKGFTGGNGASGVLQGLGSALIGGFGNVLAGGLANIISGGIGLAAKGLGKLFGGLFGGGEGKKTNDIRDDFISKNFGTSDQLRKLAAEAGVADSVMRQLFSTKKVEDFQRIAQQVSGQIGAFNGDQEADQARLQAAIEKYGFTLQDLPAKMKQAKLDDMAKDLINDWRVLLDNGFDLNLVNEKMSDSINDYLHTALKTASEVPDAMRPMLQKMVDQGLLTDLNGDKIEDLGKAGVTFSMTMTQGFDKVVQKLDELINRLQLAGQAIANMPSVPDPPSSWTAPDETPQIDQPTEGFAGGSGGRLINFAGGRSVRLHGREQIRTEGEFNSQMNNSAAILDELRRQSRSLLDMPRAIRIAVGDAVVQAR